MIVPRSKLLFWVIMIVLPFSLVGATVPSATGLSCAIIIALFTITLLDAVLACRSLNNISVESPKIVRISQNREGIIELCIKNEKTMAKRVRLGLPFPDTIITSSEYLNTVLPKGSVFSRLSWPCTPLNRGRYIIEKCYLEGTSPVGFWSRRKSIAIKTEIRVYPNLSDERKYLSALFLNRGGFGIHSQRQVGKGREFEKLREYIPGDSFDEIHWKATAKRRHPITKVFQIERTQEVYIIIDSSRLSARTAPASTRRKHTQPAHQENGNCSTMLDRFITAGLIMGLTAQKQGDLFGLLTFSNQVHNFFRANKGKAHYGICRDGLFTIQPDIVTPDFDELFTFVRLRLKRRSLLVFLTNLDDPVLAESFVKNVNLICRHHLVLVNMLHPSATRPLFSGSHVSSVADLYRALGGHIQWHGLRELGRTLHHRGIHFSLLTSEKMCLDLVSQYINIKQRQLL